MLRTATPFPQTGSYALKDEDGSLHLVRIVRRDAAGNAVVSFPLVAGASGTKTLELDALLDGTPLSDFEEGERVRLAAELHGRERPDPEKAERLEALRARAIRAPILAGLMADAEAAEQARRAA
jgi:hypothetical protein